MISRYFHLSCGRNNKSQLFIPTRLDQGPGIVVIGRPGPQVPGPHRDELRLRCRRGNGSRSVSRDVVFNIPNLTLQCTPTINFVCVSGHEKISDDSSAIFGDRHNI